MSINDVWRSISDEIGVYCKGFHYRVPAAAGVYAWFYPLKVIDYDLDRLVIELSNLNCYDASSAGRPKGTASIDLTWYYMGISLRQRPRHLTIPEALRTTWGEVVCDDGAFTTFRRNLMKASILMPPLYVGKSGNLHSRCWSHIADNIPGSFHSRFVAFARDAGLSSKTVEDLIFACVPIDDSGDPESPDEPSKDLLEALMNIAAKPPFGKKPT